MTHLFFIIGPTNAGKTTFMDTVKEEKKEKVHLVEVGRILRGMFPPEYFKGHANPAHTAQLAWDLMKEHVQKGVDAGASYVFVSGQPRDVRQAKDVITLYGHDPEFIMRFVHIYAPTKDREARARKRDTGSALELSLARMTGDLAGLYDVLSVISMFAPRKLDTYDTTDPEYTPALAFDRSVANSSNC